MRIQCHTHSINAVCMFGAAGGQHPDRLPRLRQPGVRPGRQDGTGCDQQVAGRDAACAWGTTIVMDAAVKAKVDAMWGELGL